MFSFWYGSPTTSALRQRAQNATLGAADCDCEFPRSERREDRQTREAGRGASVRIAPFQITEDAPQTASAPAAEDVGTSSSGKFLFAASKPKQEEAASWSRKGLKGERIWMKECWQRKGCDELREDHGHTGSEPGFCYVPSCAQGDVLQVPKGDVHGCFSLREEAFMRRLWCRRETVQLLPLSPIEAQLIISLRTF